ncbi:hypothetical protein T484DRAFT_3047273 [Baffinella frigidus]|nr:hypothetical protein T484DRAFT_3047273 [Cryptophyta sp. CCMP2293]
MGRTKMKDGGFHKGRYLEGRMHGFGVMQTWDGYEYQGKWHQDELHGDVMASFVFGNHEASTREVQIYSHGNLQGTRDFDPTKDWSEVSAFRVDVLGFEFWVYAGQEVRDVLLIVY